MESEIMFVEDLNIPEDFIRKTEETLELVEFCGICSDCCYTDCTGGN